jgi:hypothetical protein
LPAETRQFSRDNTDCGCLFDPKRTEAASWTQATFDCATHPVFVCLGFYVALDDSRLKKSPARQSRPRDNSHYNTHCLFYRTISCQALSAQPDPFIARSHVQHPPYLQPAMAGLQVNPTAYVRFTPIHMLSLY